MANHTSSKSLPFAPSRVFVHLTLISYLLLALLPILLVFMNSFKSRDAIFNDPLSWPTPDTFSLIGYTKVLGRSDVLMYFGNSFIVTIASLFFILLFGAMAAWGLSEYRFKGNRWLKFFFAFGIMVPIRLGTVSILQLMVELNLVNTLTALVLVYVALNLPFTIWLLYGFIDQLPIELEEAAAIDGCGPFRVFYKIVLPLLKPGLAAAAIFTFRLAWNEFILGFILTNRITRTLPASISNYITDTGVEWGKIMAAGVLIALPPLIFTFVAAKQIITGLTAGAVKG